MKLNKLKPPVSALEALRDSLPPAVAEPAPKAPRGRGTPMQLMVPDETMRALKHAAVDAGTTVRALVLDALQSAGYPVPESELGDRRRPALANASG
jgi:hypothetical protein